MLNYAALRRFSGVKFALSKPQVKSVGEGADFTPGVRRCTHRAVDATVGNRPQPPHQPPAAPHDPTPLWTAALFPEGAEAARRAGAGSSRPLTVTGSKALPFHRAPIRTGSRRSLSQAGT